MTLPTLGQRIHYTGDMANAEGMGYAVRHHQADKYAPESYDVSLDDGRFMACVRHFDDGIGCRFRIIANGPVATPLECQRRVNDETLRRKAQADQRAAQEAEVARLVELGREAVRKLGQEPKAVIVAELMQDDSDSQTDYFASHATRMVVLAFSKHTRDIFSEMRKAAAGSDIPEVRALAVDGIEHRQKWSMGAGYFLGGERGRYSGWKVSKTCLGNDVFAAIGRQCEAAPAKPQAAAPAPIDCFSGIR